MLNRYLLHESNLETPHLAGFGLLTSILIETLTSIKLELTVTFYCLQVNLLPDCWYRETVNYMGNFISLFAHDEQHTCVV